ncbi:MAG: hypothetical protein IPK99_17230 [Flavobacteriales bacterium]|nr:hypothetical protein [Flavobacteriales bacterium]
MSKRLVISAMRSRLSCIKSVYELQVAHNALALVQAQFRIGGLVHEFFPFAHQFEVLLDVIEGEGHVADKRIARAQFGRQAQVLGLGFLPGEFFRTWAGLAGAQYRGSGNEEEGPRGGAFPEYCGVSHGASVCW